MSAPQASGTPPFDDLLGRRLGSVLRVAGEHRTGLAVDRLSELLPNGSPHTGEELTAYLVAHPERGSVVEGRAFPSSASPPASDLDGRQLRGREYLRQAEGLCHQDLRVVHPLLRSIAVTGSTAYGEPEAGDDLDFLTVTRSGSMWVVLAYTYLRVRLGRRGDARAPAAPPCFNFVLEEPEALREFHRPQGLLFARESLMARPVLGVDHFRSLIGSAPWMRLELPRLYARWEREGLAEVAPAPPAPWPIRLLNLVAFPLLASYLQLQGIVRNRQFRRQGHPERGFRTITGRTRLAFASSRFEALRQTYELAAAVPAGAV